MTKLAEHTLLAVLRLRGRETGDGPPAGIDLPLPPDVGQAGHQGARSVVKVEPGEWLVVQRNHESEPASSGFPGEVAAFDESGAWRLLSLEGSAARDVVAQFCPIDFQTTGMDEVCGFATQLSGHPVVVFPRSGALIEILVRRSYAASLVALINDAIVRSP